MGMTCCCLYIQKCLGDSQAFSFEMYIIVSIHAPRLGRLTLKQTTDLATAAQPAQQGCDDELEQFQQGFDELAGVLGHGMSLYSGSAGGC